MHIAKWRVKMIATTSTEGIDEFTAGKEYEILRWLNDILFVIKNDYGMETICRLGWCAWLKCDGWKISE